MRRHVADFDQPSDGRKDIERLKQNLLNRPEIQALGAIVWREFLSIVRESAEGGHRPFEPHLQNVFSTMARQLTEDEALRRQINLGMVVLIAGVVEQQKGDIAAFLSDQIKSWDMTQLVTLIEENVGRDLQYIRFNGMLVGGFAGVALHFVEQFLRL